MAVQKSSISLPEELLTSLDEIAVQDGLTRSAADVLREMREAEEGVGD